MELRSEEFRKKLNEALSEETEPYASHPSLKDRLAHIGARRSLPSFDSNTVAAKQWLGNNHDKTVGELQKHWLENFNQQWGEQFGFKRERRNWALRVFEGTERALQERPHDPDAWVARASLAPEIMSCEDARVVAQDALAACPEEPDLQLLVAKHELIADETHGITRLLQMIEEKSDCMTKEAHSQLTDAACCGEYYSDDYPNTAALFEDQELVDLIGKLEKTAETTFDEQIIWPECPVQPARFAPWQQQAITDFCRYYDTIAKLWIFKPAETLPSYLPRYFFVVGYENGDDEEYCEGFDETFDSRDIPLRGLINHSKIKLNSREPMGRINKIMMPEAVYAIIEETAPHFDKWADAERQNAVSAARASNEEQPAAVAA